MTIKCLCKRWIKLCSSFHYVTPSWFQRIQKFLRYQVHRSTQVPVLAREPRNAELALIWRPGKYGILCQDWWLHLEMASKYSELKLPVWESLALKRPSRLLVHDKLITRHVIIHRITVQFAKWGLCLMGWHWECARRDLFKAKHFIIGNSRSGLQSLKDMRDPCSLILPIQLPFLQLSEFSFFLYFSFLGEGEGGISACANAGKKLGFRVW
jgi:hypothetical protein